MILRKTDQWEVTERPAAVEELNAALALLEDSLDDEVSLSALERGGVKVVNLFRAS